MLAVRVLVAIQLDTDQLIFTGMDQVFEGTKREIHEHYPWPILPVHWMSRDETPGNPYRHYAFKGWDGPQSMRWVHAHPTWTFWALPWLGDLLQERMQAAKGGKSMMKVWDLQRTRSGIGLYDLLKMGKRAKKDKSVEMSTPTANFMWEDEDMMNVNLWRDQANKTWCKFDLEPALYLVRRGLNQDMYFDPKWYPKGLPILFLSMHNTKGNDPTDWLLRILETCRNEPEELDCPDESVNLMGMCKMGLPEERELRLSPEKFESQVEVFRILASSLAFVCVLFVMIGPRAHRLSFLADSGLRDANFHIFEVGRVTLLVVRPPYSWSLATEAHWQVGSELNGKWYATLKEVPMTADGSPDGPVRSKAFEKNRYRTQHCRQA
ncbi:unnamed protein product [Polarella glacialis]|uniref:Uncharacterized protein n=1 Tax=Polarella glacialis TaxID=89957 RepID=A0A813KCS9_POLGL|nr:unnamed protein product [Polarella glacialis]